MQVDHHLAADPVDVVAAFAATRVRLLTVVAPFWQKAHLMLQEVKKIVPEPSVPR
jgi:hypothetical protein